MTNQKKSPMSMDMVKVKKLLDNVQEDRQPIALNLYDELVFMNSTMRMLKSQVERDGAVEDFKNGSQEFLREHPALTAYNKTLQRYMQVYKQIIDLLPKSNENNETDELMDFISQ